MTSVKIQIEPIIKRKPVIKRLSGTKRATCSLKTTAIAFRVHNRSEVALNEVKLDEIEIKGDRCSFTFGRSFKVTDLKPRESKETEAIHVFLPTAGIYWIDMRLFLDSVQRATYTITPGQTDLKDISIWSSGGTAGKPIDFCRNILPTVDLHSIRLTILTFVLAALTIGLLILTAFLILN